MRILDDELWQAAKARQAEVKRGQAEGEEAENDLRDRRRPKYLFSGLIRCGCCGGGYSMISAKLIGCSTARNKGTCGNRRNIRRDEFETRVLNALRHRLMDPDLFKSFCDEFTREMNRLRMEGRASIHAAEAELKRIDRELKKLLKAILALDDIEASKLVMRQMKVLEARQEEIKSTLTDAEEPPPLLHPSMAHHYRAQTE